MLLHMAPTAHDSACVEGWGSAATAHQYLALEGVCEDGGQRKQAGLSHKGAAQPATSRPQEPTAKRTAHQPPLSQSQPHCALPRTFRICVSTSFCGLSALM